MTTSGRRKIALMEQIRRRLSALDSWPLFRLLYAASVLLLFSGLVLTSQAWWDLVHQGAGLLAIGVTTVEAIVLAATLISILIIPHVQKRNSSQEPSQRGKREAEQKVAPKAPCRIGPDSLEN